MAVGRLRTPERSQDVRDAIRRARLEGESDGRLYGRNDERRQISLWLRCQVGSPEELARKIDLGDHTRF